MRMGEEVSRVIIRSSCWHVLWYMKEQVLVEITLNKLLNLQILLVLRIRSLLWQEVLSHKPLVIRSLEL